MAAAAVAGVGEEVVGEEVVVVGAVPGGEVAAVSMRSPQSRRQSPHSMRQVRAGDVFGVLSWCCLFFKNSVHTLPEYSV